MIMFKLSNVNVFDSYHLIVWSCPSSQALSSELETLWSSWGSSQFFLSTNVGVKTEEKKAQISKNFVIFQENCTDINTDVHHLTQVVVNLKTFFDFNHLLNKFLSKMLNMNSEVFESEGNDVLEQFSRS